MLSWNKVIDMDNDLAGYVVYRTDPKVDEEAYQDISGVLTETNFKDKTVEYEKWYFYRVGALDKSGNESDFSNLAEVWMGIATD